MNKTMTYLVITVFLGEISFSQCEEYDSQLVRLTNVVVRVGVSFDQDKQVFVYSYYLANGRLSTGCIKQLDLDISYPESGIELSQENLVDYPRYVQRSALTAQDARRVIPVGIPALPEFKGFSSAWWAGFSVDGRLGWMGADRSLYLEPGGKLDGIVLTSFGLPSLRSFVIHPSYHPLPKVVVTPANEDSVRRHVLYPTDEQSRAFLRLEDSIKVRGVTIGPTAPPAKFIGSTFLDTLLSYTRQSAELGWLAPFTGLARDRDNDCDNDEKPEDGIVRNIEQRLNKAKRQLERGDSVLARRELEKLVSKVERLWKRSQDDDKKDKRDRWEKPNKVVMTSEAYALLKYNTEYLIDRLPDRKPKKGSKEKD